MNEYELDESLEPKGFSRAIIAILVGVCCGGGRIVARDGLTGKTVLVLVSTAVVCVLLMLPFLALAKKARLLVTAQGVSTRSITGKEAKLNWADMRTAAIVRINKREDQRMILLSPKIPQEALESRKTVLKKTAKEGGLLFPYGDKRREAIEHFLNKELPEFNL